MWEELVGALPFVTTWRTTQANETIVLPTIIPQTGLAIDWGDDTTSNITDTKSSLVLNHTYASPGLHNVSMGGQLLWTGQPFFWYHVDNTTREKLVDISNWGDGFLVDHNTHLFANYINLQVSASPDTQPVFLPGAHLDSMFYNTSFNSSLNWDLTNVTSLHRMLGLTPLNQPITFRNTQRVETTGVLFYDTPYFNQPFHFDASGLRKAALMFFKASSFDQVVNLTNSTQLTDTSGMFTLATSFNQPITFDTSSVIDMMGMFARATSFNQPITFNTSQVEFTATMFYGAESFNQPINFNSPLINTRKMFSGARSFNQPVVLNTSNVTVMAEMFHNASSFNSTVTFTSTAKVTDMESMFDGADGFTQDLSSWSTRSVRTCSNFCDWCGLPTFRSCSPCPLGYTRGQKSCGGTTPSAAAPVFPALGWAVVLLPSCLAGLLS